MTWKNVNKALASMGVLAALALVSGADFIDGFALFFSAPDATASATVSAPAAPAVAPAVKHHR